MDLKLAGELAIVFGGAHGLGAAIGRAFAAEGARVVVVDRAAEAMETARSIGAAAGVETIGIVADVTDGAALRAAADQVQSRFGRRGAHLVYAAGVGSGKFGFPFWNVPAADWGRVLDVNLVGAAQVAQAFAPALVEARAGTILFIASVAGQIGSQTDPPYSASKAGLINFAQCAARDLAPYGVRVNALCPGMVKTALNRAVHAAWAARQPESERIGYEEWADDKVRRLVPLARWQEPEDVAAMAVFLASSRARNVTGQTINVDGGYVMHW